MFLLNFYLYPNQYLVNGLIMITKFAPLPTGYYIPYQPDPDMNVDEVIIEIKKSGNSKN